MANRKVLTISSPRINQGIAYTEIMSEEHALIFLANAPSLGYTVISNTLLVVPDTVPAITPIRGEGGTASLDPTQEAKLAALPDPVDSKADWLSGEQAAFGQKVFTANKDTDLPFKAADWDEQAAATTVTTLHEEVFTGVNFVDIDELIITATTLTKVRSIAIEDANGVYVDPGDFKITGQAVSITIAMPENPCTITLFGTK